MKQEVKEQWLKALRSGEYKQTRTQLKLDSFGRVSYCCLGVLCDISGVNSWYGVYYGSEGFFLPGEVADWAELTPMEREAMASFATLNDTGSTFEEIADAIETRIVVDSTPEVC